MSNLDFISEKLSELTLDELTKLEAAIYEERLNREQRKYRDLLKQWTLGGTKEEPRAVKHMSFQSKQNWIVVVAIFCGTRQEMFRELHSSKDEAHELAAEDAFRNSALIKNNGCEPMVIW